ncbi:MAG: hypothetical protein U0Z44_11995 [Kouleothrix sp.]
MKPITGILAASAFEQRNRGLVVERGEADRLRFLAERGLSIPDLLNNLRLALGAFEGDRQR